MLETIDVVRIFTVDNVKKTQTFSLVLSEDCTVLYHVDVANKATRSVSGRDLALNEKGEPFYAPEGVIRAGFPPLIRTNPYALVRMNDAIPKSAIERGHVQAFRTKSDAVAVLYCGGFEKQMLSVLHRNRSEGSIFDWATVKDIFLRADANTQPPGLWSWAAEASRVEIDRMSVSLSLKHSKNALPGMIFEDSDLVEVGDLF